MRGLGVAQDLDPVVAVRRKAAEETAARLTAKAFNAPPLAQPPAFGIPADQNPLVAAAQAAANKLVACPRPRPPPPSVSL